METLASGAPVRITDSSRATVVAAWLFAAVWNALSWTTAVVAGRELRDWRLAAVALFPLVGAGLLVWAVRATMHYRRFGTSVVELPDGAGVIGRGIAGTVLVPAGLPASAPFDVTLRRIVRTTSGSGRNRRTSESTHWEERSTVAGRTDGRHVRVPVAFRIPATEAPSDPPAGRSRVLWRLEVSAEVPGVDYRARFEVPVVAAPAGEAPDADKFEAQLPPVADPASYRPGPGSRIRVVSNRRGTEIVYPSARNPGPATGLTLFLVLWCGAIAGMVALGAPLLFPIVFGFFALLMLVGVLQMWLGVTRVEVDRGVVTVTRGLLGGGRPRTLRADEVADVTVAIGMQVGGRPYYDVRLVRSNGRKLTAGSGVRDKREAEWLAHTISRGLAG